MPARILTAFVALILSVAVACTSQPEEAETGRLKVVASVSPITSIVENIGGDRIDLIGIIPEGVDSHTYEPPPSVVKAISQADLIVLSLILI